MGSCKVLLQDVKERYPALKDTDSVRVPRNAAALNKKVIPQTEAAKSSPKKRAPAPNYKEHDEDEQEQEPIKQKRKYRKRSEVHSSDTTPHSRRAKISHKELKQRLQMVKKEEKSWNCPYCVKIYHMYKPFEKHLVEDHQKTEEEVREEYKQDQLVVGDEVFKCPVCDKIYLVEKRLQSHLSLHGKRFI